MFDIDTAEQVGKAFEKKYPGVQVQVVRATAGVISQRVLQESEAGVFADDVFSSTEEGHYLNFKDKKLIRPYLPVTLTRWSSASSISTRTTRIRSPRSA